MRLHVYTMFVIMLLYDSFHLNHRSTFKKLVFHITISYRDNSSVNGSKLTVIMCLFYTYLHNYLLFSHIGHCITLLSS